jgi:hypothetical protein
MTQIYTAEQLNALRTMVDDTTGSSYSIRVIPTNPDIVELSERAGERAWLPGKKLIDIKAGAENIMGTTMMVREMGARERVLELTPTTEGQRWPTTS